MGFKNWMLKGLHTLKDLCEGGSLITFRQLVTKYNFPQKHFFKYLQIRSYVYSCIRTYLEPPLSTALFKAYERRTILSRIGRFPYSIKHYWLAQKKILSRIF